MTLARCCEVSGGSRWDRSPVGVFGSQLFTETLETCLSARDGEKIREALEEVYSNEPSDFDGALVQLQSATMPNKDW